MLKRLPAAGVEYDTPDCSLSRAINCKALKAVGRTPSASQSGSGAADCKAAVIARTIAASVKYC